MVLLVMLLSVPNMFSYIWRPIFAAQGISAALQNFIIMLFWHIFYIHEKSAGSTIWIGIWAHCNFLFFF